MLPIVNLKVAITIKNMVNIGIDNEAAMIALCVAMTFIMALIINNTEKESRHYFEMAYRKCRLGFKGRIEKKKYRNICFDDFLAR